MISAVDHVQLAMPPGGEDEAAAFYEGVLGIPRVPKPPYLAKRGDCWFESDAVKIHLGVEGDFRPAKKAHPALLVDGLDRLIGELELAGHRVNSAEAEEAFARSRRAMPSSVDLPVGGLD
jgi:hypothetical protein